MLIGVLTFTGLCPHPEYRLQACATYQKWVDKPFHDAA